MADTVTASVRTDERIDTLDVLRGIAICGILLMNIPSMGLIGDTALPPLPATWNLDWIVLTIQNLLFSGTMRGLFTMLFGAGMLLMLRRTFADRPDIVPIDVWMRRCLALMALGLVQCAVFMWPGEILWNYGLCGLALLAFRTARPRALLVAAAVMLLALSCILGWQKVDHVRAMQAGVPLAAARAAGTPLTDEQKLAVVPFDKAGKTLHPTREAIGKEYRDRTRVPSLIAWSWGIWSYYNLSAESWLWTLESLGFMLIGMALYRSGVLTGAAPRRAYLSLMLVGYPAGLALRTLSLWYALHSSFDFDVTRVDIGYAGLRGFAYEPGRLLITLGHVGLIVLLFRGGVFGRAWPLRALGRMALTVYSLESIVTSVMFYGFGYVGAFGFAALMGIAVAIWIGCGLFCVFWLKRHEMGPAEWLLRSVAYATFRRRRGDAATVLAASPAL